MKVYLTKLEVHNPCNSGGAEVKGSLEIGDEVCNFCWGMPSSKLAETLRQLSTLLRHDWQCQSCKVSRPEYSTLEWVGAELNRGDWYMTPYSWGQYDRGNYGPSPNMRETVSFIKLTKK